MTFRDVLAGAVLAICIGLTIILFTATPDRPPPLREPTPSPCLAPVGSVFLPCNKIEPSIYPAEWWALGRDI